MLHVSDTNQQQPMQERRLPTGEHKEARIEFANRFLQEVLIPYVKDGPLDQPESIIELYEEFQFHNPGLGSDCSLANVWGVAWEADMQNASLIRTQPRWVPDNADDLSRVVAMLESIIFDDSTKDR